MNQRYESWLRTVLTNWGSLEAYQEAQRKHGGKGGKAKNPHKGFGSNRKLARSVGQKTKRQGQ